MISELFFIWRIRYTWLDSSTIRQCKPVVLDSSRLHSVCKLSLRGGETTISGWSATNTVWPHIWVRLTGPNEWIHPKMSLILSLFPACRFSVSIWTNGLWTGDWAWLALSCTPSFYASPSSSSLTSSSSSTFLCAETSTDPPPPLLFLLLLLLPLVDGGKLSWLPGFSAPWNQVLPFIFSNRKIELYMIYLWCNTHKKRRHRKFFVFFLGMGWSGDRTGGVKRKSQQQRLLPIV